MRSDPSLTGNLDDLRYALDQSAIVATTDTRGVIKFVNEKFCQVSKYSRAELLGQDHRILNSGYHSKEFMRSRWVTIANGRRWRGSARWRPSSRTRSRIRLPGSAARSR